MFCLLKQFPEQECVPVILSDQMELPFQDVVDYTKISIKLPSTSIGSQLLEYLESIPGTSIASPLHLFRNSNPFES